MEKFDIALAYTWEYDEDFITLTEEMFHSENLTTFLIKPFNVFEITERLKNRNLAFNCYLDRASDVDDKFSEIAHILTRRNVRIFNPYKKVHHAIDKASMHLEFITAGINTPYSIIIPPYSEKEQLYISLDDLEILDRPFIIKPCNTTGGGMGVVTGAETLKDVLHHRTNLNNDKYILQEKIYPVILNNKRSWFRCFWAFGKPLALWWNDITHEYTILTKEEIDIFELRDLFTITRKIAKLTELDFFSTEIVYSTKEKFVAVDYVNDQCDMRLKSKHFDGVPDEIARQIITNMITEVKKQKAK
jgi:hypothetical protein